MSHKKGPLTYELLLLLTSIIWGSSFVAQQIGMERGLGPMTFNALRFALGGLSLVPVMLLRRKRQDVCISGDGTRFPLLGSAAAGLFLFAAASFQQVGLQYTTSANAGFITGFYIVFVPLLGIPLGHRATAGLWNGIVICMIGLYLLSITDSFVISRGDLLILVCAVLWACQILVIDHIAEKGDPIRIAFLQFVVCAVLSAVASILFETCTLDQVKAGAGAVAYAGIGSVGIAFTLQVICQTQCPPAPAAIILSLEAVFAAITGYVVLHQTLTLRGLAGCILIFCGVLTVQLLPMIKKRA